MEDSGTDPAQQREQDGGLKQFNPMLIGYACPVERPIDKGAGHEHDDRIRQDDAPKRENTLVEMARHEAGQSGGVMNVGHY